MWMANTKRSLHSDLNMTVVPSLLNVWSFKNQFLTTYRKIQGQKRKKIYLTTFLKRLPVVSAFSVVQELRDTVKMLLFKDFPSSNIFTVLKFRTIKTETKILKFHCNGLLNSWLEKLEFCHFVLKNKHLLSIIYWIIQRKKDTILSMCNSG